MPEMLGGSKKNSKVNIMLINNKQILTAVIFFILGAILFYSISKLQLNSPKSERVIVTRNFLIDKYFPIQKGDYWMYEGIKREEMEDGRVETNKVQKRVEVLEIHDTTDGKLVVLGGSEPAKYLIKDNSIDFHAELPPEAKIVWTFPLYVGQKFGSEDNLRSRDDGFYVEQVEEKLSKEVLGKKYNECFKVSYKGIPDTSYKIFCYGLGIVEEGYKHNGTVLEWTYTLSDFSL